MPERFEIEVDADTAGFRREMDRAGDAVDNLEKDFAAAGREADGLRSDFAAAGRSANSMEDGFDNAEKGIEGLTREMRQAGNVADDTRRDFGELGNSAMGAGAAAGGAGGKVGGLVGGLGAIAGPAALAAAGIAALSAAFAKTAEFVANSLEAYGEYEASLQRLAVLNIDPNVFGPELIDIARDLGREVTDVADAYYEATSALDDSSRAAEVVEAAFLAQSATGANAADVVKTIALQLNTYGDAAGTAEEAVDGLIAVERSGIVTTEQFASVYGTFASQAAQAGVSQMELNAIFAAASKSGQSPETVATQLKGLFTALDSLKDPTSNLNALLKENGLEISQADVASGAWRETMVTLIGATRDRASELKTALGTEEAYVGLVQTLADEGNRVASAYDAQSLALGETQRLAAENEGSLSRLQERYSAIAGVVQTQFGELFGPAAEAVLDGVIDALTDLSEWISANQGTLIAIGEAIGQVVSAAITYIRGLIDAILLPFKTLFNVLEGVGRFLGLLEGDASESFGNIVGDLRSQVETIGTVVSQTVEAGKTLGTAISGEAQARFEAAKEEQAARDAEREVRDAALAEEEARRDAAAAAVEAEKAAAAAAEQQKADELAASKAAAEEERRQFEEERAQAEQWLKDQNAAREARSSAEAAYLADRAAQANEAADAEAAFIAQAMAETAAREAAAAEALAAEQAAAEEKAQLDADILAAEQRFADEQAAAEQQRIEDIKAAAGAEEAEYQRRTEEEARQAEAAAAQAQREFEQRDAEIDEYNRLHLLEVEARERAIQSLSESLGVTVQGLDTLSNLFADGPFDALSENLLKVADGLDITSQVFQDGVIEQQELIGALGSLGGVIGGTLGNVLQGGAGGFNVASGIADIAGLIPGVGGGVQSAIQIGGAIAGAIGGLLGGGPSEEEIALQLENAAFAAARDAAIEGFRSASGKIADIIGASIADGFGGPLASEGVREFLTRTFQEQIQQRLVEDAFEPIFEQFGSVSDRLSELVQGALDGETLNFTTTGRLFDDVLEEAGQLADQLDPILAAVFRRFGGIAADAGEEAGEEFSEGVDRGLMQLEEDGDDRGLFMGAAQGAMEQGEMAGEAFAEGFEEAAETGLDEVEVGSAIVAQFQGVAGQLSQVIGQAIGEGLTGPEVDQKAREFVFKLVGTTVTESIGTALLDPLLAQTGAAVDAFLAARQEGVVADEQAALLEIHDLIGESGQIAADIANILDPIFTGLASAAEATADAAESSAAAAAAAEESAAAVKVAAEDTTETIGSAEFSPPPDQAAPPPIESEAVVDVAIGASIEQLTSIYERLGEHTTLFTDTKDILAATQQTQGGFFLLAAPFLDRITAATEATNTTLGGHALFSGTTLAAIQSGIDLSAAALGEIRDTTQSAFFNPPPWANWDPVLPWANWGTELPWANWTNPPIINVTVLPNGDTISDLQNVG